MDNSYDFDEIITNILKTTQKNEVHIDKKKELTENEKRCHTLEGLQYCLEMHKVKNNKKADFDIHNNSKLNIEDEDIDKFKSYSNWNDLSEEFKNEKIKEFILHLQQKHNLDNKSIDKLEILINSNIKNIKYNKYQEKIIDLVGLVYKKDINCFNMNTIKTSDKKNSRVKNSRLSKLRTKVNIEKNKLL